MSHSRLLLSFALVSAIAVSDSAKAQSVLVVDGQTVTLHGAVRDYDHICVLNGGVIEVARHAGGDTQALGNLELLASTVYVDAASSIIARGRGYQAAQCSDGGGATAVSGGRGGCSVFDSGGGGAHFGAGGRGTVDLPGTFFGEVSFEDDCDYDFSPNGGGGTASTGPGGTCPATGQACGTAMMSCPDGRGGRFCRIGPTVAGLSHWHNIYAPEFGSAGGDKGCLDGDGRNPGAPIVGGHGGGRVVVAGLRHLGDGSQSPCGAQLMPGEVRFDGELDAGGTRGCGHGNDSGGGGAGGTVLVVGEAVSIGAGARVSAAGGLGGDTNAKANDPYGDCPANSQNAGGTCDDCGGGGGGGIISVLSVTSSIESAAVFDVSGAPGGTCSLCQGEAGGGAGELQLDGAYVGEYCDGYDNDFDGVVDEGLGTVTCGNGACAMPIPACENGIPTTCVPTVGVDATCQGDIDRARGRIAVVLDSSASMLLDLPGDPTFGDGSVEHPGLDTDGDGLPNDSRLFLAREAVAQVVSAYPEIDFGLARYHQDQAAGRACQTAAWFECQDLVASYDEPVDTGGNGAGNTGPIACAGVTWGNAIGTIDIRQEPSPNDDEECINYAGSCGPPRRGADVLSGFGSKVTDLVRWLDGRETDFRPGAVAGDVCEHSQGGDCELRATGPTPLAGSLLAMEDYITPIRATDPAAACRDYAVIMVTDGAESCNGDPVAAAARLHDTYGIEVYVIAVSVRAEELASLDAIAQAGSGGERGAAIPVSSAQELVTSLTAIVAGAIRTETCNQMDDDCDGAVDEDFPSLGAACDDGLLGVCRGAGTLVCNGSGDGTICDLTMPGATPEVEACNQLDDDCDERIDEGLDCRDSSCVPTGAEICDGDDDDCDGVVDETDPALDALCGNAAGECTPGRTRCVAGVLQCVGQQGPMDEVCDGDDDDCDGEIDNDAPCPDNGTCFEGACRRRCDPQQEFACPFGMLCEAIAEAEGTYCLPSVCATCSDDERCVDDTCVDLCAGVDCGDGQQCQGGECVDCHVLGCGEGERCVAGACEVDACLAANCADDAMCVDDVCQPVCDDAACGPEQTCDGTGQCTADPCSSVECEPGTFCDAGSCRDNPCANMRCLLGDVCAPALGCIDDPCATVSCPAGRHCAVTDAGGVQCTLDRTGTGTPGGPGPDAGPDPAAGGPTDTPEPRVVTVGGASNFGCAVGARAPHGPVPGVPWIAAGWCLWGLSMRRRRRPRPPLTGRPSRRPSQGGVR